MSGPTTPPNTALLAERVRARRDDILRLAQSYGITDVRLFGSVARGQTRSESDVDLLIEPPARFSLFDLVGLKQDLEDLLGCHVDVVTAEGLHWYIRDRVLAEAVPL